MHKIFLLISTFLMIVVISSCSKKTHPSGTTGSTSGVHTDSIAVEKKVVRIKTATPKVITVNDRVAKRSVDGRYYYDLEGHRYWRNNRDGKYYLFHKSMFDNPDFKSPVAQ
ncbi:MAG: hypothetical protein ABI666_10675 [Ferruginibacter sp.]